MKFSLTEDIIDPTALREEILSKKAGAYCSYEGWVRDHNAGNAVTELHYSSYPELGNAVGETILREARDQFDIETASLVHRSGPLQVGEIAVWVGVIAPHRDDAFLACRYIIDNVKFRLPIWKKEIYSDGSSAWIGNRIEDASSTTKAR